MPLVYTHAFHIVAVTRVAAEAHLALTADYVDLADNALADKGGIIRFNYLTDKFMPHDSFIRQITPGDFDVGVADTGKRNPYQSLSPSPFRDRHFRCFDTSVKYQSSHARSPSGETFRCFS